MSDIPGAVPISICSVWWDDKNCQLPPDADESKLERNIRCALYRSSFDLNGPVEIRTFSDVMKKDESTTNILSPGKEAIVNKITSEMIFWRNDNPGSSAIFLISGNGIFSDTLGRLKMRRYPTMVARPRGGAMSHYLFPSAKHVWDWPSLAMGTYFDPLSETQIRDEVKKGIVFEPIPEVHEPRKKKRKKSKSQSDGQQVEN